MGKKDLEAKTKELEGKMKELEAKLEGKTKELDGKTNELDFKTKAFDEKVSNLQRDLLRANSLFTARGVFEFVTKQAFEELKEVCRVKPTSRFNVSDTLHTLHNFESDKLDNASFPHYCYLLISARLACRASNSQANSTCEEGKELVQVYQELSQAVHGYPWNGQCVLLSDRLSPFSTCVV